MKVNYRGYEIEAERHKSMTGYDLVHLSIVRLSDNYFVEYCPMYSSGETVHEIIKNAKTRIDLVEDCRVDNEIKGLEKKVRENQTRPAVISRFLE